MQFELVLDQRSRCLQSDSLRLHKIFFRECFNTFLDTGSDDHGYDHDHDPPTVLKNQDQIFSRKLYPIPPKDFVHLMTYRVDTSTDITFAATSTVPSVNIKLHNNVVFEVLQQLANPCTLRVCVSLCMCDCGAHYKLRNGSKTICRVIQKCTKDT